MASGARNLNGGIAGGVLARCDADAEVAACDALPPALRALIKGSFVNTQATTVLAQWRDLEAQGVPLAAYVDWYARRLALNTAKSCLVTYGPGHPDATLGHGSNVHSRDQSPTSYQLDDRGDRARAAHRAAEISLDDV